MGIDGLGIHFLSIEINQLIQGARIDKITQSSKDFFQIHLYVNRQKRQLLLSTHPEMARISISNNSYTNLQVPHSFCMLLKKHLQNAIVERVEQVAYERIIAIYCNCNSEFSIKQKVLYCEIMGKYSNLILVQDGIILGALKSIPLSINSKRNLLVGAKYSLPPKQEKLTANALDNLAEYIPAYLNGNFANFLFHCIAGLSLPTSRELAKCIVDKLQLKESEILPTALQNKIVLQNLQQAIAYFLLQSPPSPSIEYEEDCPKKLYPITFDRANKQILSSMIECVEKFFIENGERQKLQQKRYTLQQLCMQHLKKEEKKLQMLRQQQENCINLEENRLYGELITANIYAIRKGDDSCTVCNYYTENQTMVKIPLDSQLSPSENAQCYYNRYNKQKRTVVATAEQIERVENEIAYWREMLEMLALAEELDDFTELEAELSTSPLPKKKNTKKIEQSNYRKYTIAGFIVCIGRNMLQNDRLLKESREYDIWLHAQKLTSAHAIIFTNKQAVPDAVIQQVAEIVAYFSAGRENGKVTIDYCQRKYVKRPPKTKAGFVTYTQFKSILVQPKKHEDIEN